ncbi:unnamed protein product [Rotaria sp. Silwood2]|nr:unnamed protein product [Rotaria sp. Silwood2]CAF3075110.1 unnamed protein product [Rotaria sp. Silwood2]CAF3952861.1 unnamed protein product [Rotaria sp. Silwood2]CAF4059609.1 unnamed protein product [Rotaria sp. Silwood2]CAF4326448.1 unnamed protein product [Rotaria sp. Silwood2]
MIFRLVTHDGLDKLLAGYDDKKAYVQCVFPFCAEPSYQSIIFTCCCPGCIVAERGPHIFNYDPIFLPDNKQGQTDDKIFVEMDRIIKKTN